MKLLLIVPFIGFVFAAPVAENDKSIRPIVKRAMETIMFGNQQNSAKHVKKSDPSIPLRYDLPDVKGPVLPDEGGVVKASEAKNIPETETINEDEMLKDELKQKEQEESVGENKEESAASEEQTPEIVNKVQSTGVQSSEETEIPKEDAEAIEELEDSVRNGKPENTDVQSTNNGGYEETSNSESPYDIYELYKQYQNMLSQYPRTGMGMDYYDLNRRRRAIRKRQFRGNLMKERAVKRTHRNKRDLAYPDDRDLYYYTPEDDSELNQVYSGYDRQSEYPYSPSSEVDYLLDILRKNEENEYESKSPYWYGSNPVYEDDEDVLRPSKRQMLSFVPGNKKRYFYPVSEEPDTHFRAFVPQKRDYFDTYGSLVRAARQLAARQEEQEELQGYPEWY